MEDHRYELPEHLILARQAVLLRTFFKLVAALTAIALLLIIFLPGFAAQEDIREPFARNTIVLLAIGVLYYLVHKERVLASIYGTIIICGVMASYSIFQESPGNMQMMTLIVFPTCVAGLLPSRPQFWLVYLVNMVLMFFTVWLIQTYRGVELEYRSIVTIAMLHTLIALLIDTLSSSYRASLRTTFTQLLRIEAAEQTIERMDADLARAVEQRLKAESVSNKLAKTGELALEVSGGSAITISLTDNSVELNEEFTDRYSLGRNPIQIPDLLQLIHTEDRDALQDMISRAGRTRERVEGDFRVQSTNPVYWMIILEASSERGSRVLHGIVVDVTSRVLEQIRRIEEENKIQESQRLESLGVLAGAIAHDFNNLLHVIMLNADLARQGLNPDTRSAVSINRVMTTVQRAADLCTELLAYSGKGSISIEPFHVGELVIEMQKLLELSIPKGTTIEYNSDDSDPLIEGDVTQIRQVVMNLITNAGEAIASENNGLITLSTRSITCDEKYISDHKLVEPLTPGRYVAVTVEDNGAGMDDATQARIFDPFFSTKETGHGLGLSAVRGIVRGHNGSIEIDASPGHGTRITILLPIAADNARELEAPAHPGLSQGSRRILFADDEPEIRQLARVVLEELGYTVIDAADGDEALDIYEQQHEKLQLVILDLMMPGKTAIEAYTDMTTIDNSVPIVFSSGFNESEILARLPEKSRSSFLKKPYMARDLEEFVKAIIGPRGQS
jgi:signal transduction histidine kinase